ncbi:hypothetical protein MUNTM_35200 [Mycobacterium sp. MUNTM1]
MASVCADLQTWISGGLPDVRLIADEDLQGWQRYPDCVADQAVSAVPGEREGELLQYSPGTTGRPKGIKRALQHTSPDRAVDILGCWPSWGSPVTASTSVRLAFITPHPRSGRARCNARAERLS